MINTKNAFSGFSVDNIEKAKEFYSKTLGMDINDSEMGTAEIKLGSGASVMLYPKENHTPAEYTMLNIPVDNIDEAVDELTGRGVKFIKYNTGDIKTDDKGIMRGNGPNIAWFSDPAGNIISVLETT